MIRIKSVSDLRIGMCTSCQRKFEYSSTVNQIKIHVAFQLFSPSLPHFAATAALSNRPDKLQSHCMVYFNLPYSISVYHLPFASIQSSNFNFDFNLTKIQFGCVFFFKQMVCIMELLSFTNCIRSLLIRCLQTQNISAYVV